MVRRRSLAIASVALLGFGAIVWIVARVQAARDPVFGLGIIPYAFVAGISVCLGLALGIAAIVSSLRARDPRRARAVLFALVGAWSGVGVGSFIVDGYDGEPLETLAEMLFAPFTVLIGPSYRDAWIPALGAVLGALAGLVLSRIPRGRPTPSARS